MLKEKSPVKSKTRYFFPAKAWTEAMPLGNGSLGAMVFFDTNTERIALNHDTLWSGIPKDEDRPPRKGAREAFKKAKALALEDKYYESQQEIQNNFLDYNGEKYLPLGDIFINFGHENVSGYKRELDFESATASASYLCEDVIHTRSCYVSHPDKCLVYKIEAENGTVSFELSFTSRLKGNLFCQNGTLIFDGECPGYSYVDFIEDNKFDYRDGIYRKGISFRAALKIETDGKVAVAEGKFVISDAKNAVIYFSAESNFVSPFVYPELGGKEYRNKAVENLEKALNLGFDKLHKRHTKDFSALYNKVELNLGTSGKDDLPTDERLISFVDTKDDLSLYTLLFDFARYLTISGSRKGTRAMNLQGIWNDKMPAPWRCNYTVNINAEMNYWPTLPSGLPECHEPLIELVKVIAKNGRKTARHYYGARGFVTHHNVDIWGHTVPVKWMTDWGFWPGGSGWLSRHLYEHYEYTLDEKFLKKTAYPIIKEAATFYMDISTQLPDGRIAIVPGTSPENNFIDNKGRRTSVGKYSAMINCIAYETIKNAVKCCHKLGADEEFVKNAEEILSKFITVEIGNDGRILEWNDTFPENDPKHRHVSHLYALHPADMITSKTPELMEAARKTLEVRGDDGTGWSLGWKINFHARLGDGNRALKLLERQLAFVPAVDGFRTHPGAKSGTYLNLFDAHPPFQIDGNFALASGVYEMIARVIGDDLYLLPALPDKLKNGSIKGMHLKGGGILSMIWRDGKVETYEIKGGIKYNVHK